jgi:sugar lactone lactonase YvrE
VGDVTLTIDGLGIPESTRWRDGRVWVRNWGSGEVLAVAPSGERDVITRLAPQTLPFSIDWLPDGRLLAVDGPGRLLLRLEPDGTLPIGRVWAELEHPPDGICGDSDGAIWVATVPGQRCIRVREGGDVLDTVAADRGCFACILGGQDGRTLFIAAAQWRGMDALVSNGPGLTGQLLAAPDQRAPHAGRP